MIFKQVFDNKTSTFTYIIASAKGREAVIIDPVVENVEEYIVLLKNVNNLYNNFINFYGK